MLEGNVERKSGSYLGGSDKVERVDFYSGPLAMGTWGVSKVVIM